MRSNSIEKDSQEREVQPVRPLVTDLPRWRLWRNRNVIFSVMFVFLLAVFSALSAIVERFFFMLYVD